MLLWLFYDFAEYFQPLNLLRYITVRTGGGIITALIISFILGPHIIRWLKLKQAGYSNIREDVPDSHLAKAGTPSMGGLLILISMTISILLWANLENPYIWIVLFVTIGFGILGFADDFLKLSKKNSKGLPGRFKLVGQIVIAGIAAYWINMLAPSSVQSGLAIPFLKEVILPLGFAYIPFMIIVMAGSSNSVNLTDGLDGLAIGPVIIAAACFGLITYIVGNSLYAKYLNLFFIPGAGELAIICGTMIGAGLGFLWFNAPPAMVFMGDTGSLSLGGALGAMAVVARHEIVLMVIGGLFVLETVSVIVQVASFKLTGKRVFAMAPLHHHFEKKGWAESTIVFRFWIIAIILALVGLSTLKLR